MKKTLLFVASALMSMAMMAQKAQVWDLGAEQLDATKYQNMLSVDEINSWYPSTVTPGSESKSNEISGINASEGVNFKFDGGGKSNHRIRTTNTAITRYDSRSLKDATDDNIVYTGYLYSNAGSTTSVYVEQEYQKDDKIEFYVGSNGNPATYEVLSPSNKKTNFEFTKTGKIQKFTYYVGENGKHKIYSLNEKLVVARIIRTPATYATVSGSITAPAGIPTGYSLVFTNQQTGSVVEATPAAGAYSAQLAIGYDYEVSLKNANGYVISSSNPIKAESATLTYDVTIDAVELVTVTGSIVGLPDDQLAKLEVEFTLPAGKIYVPELTINNDATYTLVLEKDVEYGVTALNVNDYQISIATIQAAANRVDVEIVFTLKPRYDVTIVPTGATAADLAAAVFTFTRLDDEYVYNFTGTEGIILRDGVYTVKTSNTGAYVQLLTSNLRVEGAATSKQIDFTADIHEWIFNAEDFTSAGYSNTSETYTYKTLEFTGCKSHNNTYLYAGNGGEIKVPVKGNSIITVNACYEYHLYVGETVLGDEKTGSTSQIDALTYAYQGAEGVVTISAKGTCYINSISVQMVTDYKPVVTVGEGKDYETINDALNAIARMTRTNDQNVTILIEPGNYEEMLRIRLDNITLKNAAENPSLALANGGVDINEDAVRITSYYGHGYNYYSMDSEYKWNARALAVNKDNGYTNVVNKGGSSDTYWNSTVVVYGKDFSAEGIIFENSYNQYISKKESEDVLVVIPADNKPIRPTNEGNTEVQARNYRERACALAFAKGSDRGYLKNCRVISRQDALYGDNGVRVAVEGGILNGACDYIFGGMALAVKEAELAMLVTSDNNDVAYITASKTNSGARGYLFYECSVTSAEPGVEMAETEFSKPGYFGRPWDANAETVFYNTKVGKNGNTSLIAPAGWNNGLVSSGAARSYEYGTIEEAGVDNSAQRVSWSTVLQAPQLPDNTAITLFNFTKGNDSWDPFGEGGQAIENTSVEGAKAVKVIRDGQVIIVRGEKEYSIFGQEVK